MVHSGEISPCEGREDAERMLEEIRGIVEAALEEEVFQDITDRETVFYAPEHEGWKDFLDECNGNEDYRKALEGYTDGELEILWAESHQADRMDEERIQKKIFREISGLKMLELLDRKKYLTVKPEEKHWQKLEARAKIKGFYNLLYEGGMEG